MLEIIKSWKSLQIIVKESAFSKLEDYKGRITLKGVEQASQRASPMVDCKFVDTASALAAIRKALVQEQ